MKRILLSLFFFTATTQAFAATDPSHFNFSTKLTQLFEKVWNQAAPRMYDFHLPNNYRNLMASRYLSLTFENIVITHTLGKNVKIKELGVNVLWEDRGDLITDDVMHVLAHRGSSQALDALAANNTPLTTPYTPRDAKKPQLGYGSTTSLLGVALRIAIFTKWVEMRTS